MRAILAVWATLLAVASVGCGGGGEGSSTDCGLNQCTVTFERGVDANANILGIEAELVRVEGDIATIAVAGEEVQLQVDQQTEVAAFTVSLREINDDNVKVRIELTG